MMNALFTADQWLRVGELFDRFCEMPAKARDLKSLDEPAAVVDMLERMLKAHDSDDPQLLDRTVHAMAGQLLTDGEAVAVDYTGRRFGPWRALEEVGRGGMAVVLRGERADGQFEKEVAIKLLPQAGSEGERDRLIEEIRILARLEHSSVARLIDGGIDDDGTPYLVMEYVHGVPITDHCRANGLGLRDRLGLFEQVVEAVQFAHRHLIVHCDIKPANILVTENGQAKLVDFGIASLISTGAGSEATTRGLLCSPGYCAPEQLRGAPPATSQDVYNLGAVLYELLSEKRIRANDIATRLLFGARRIVESIPPPSQHHGRSDRDLDAVCMKALASEPEQRYRTADALLADLQHWHRREGVSARAGGWPYHAGKWLQRNYLAAGMGALALLALVTGLGAAIWQAQRAGLEAQRAHEEATRATTIKDFLLSLFRAGDPLRVGGPVLDTREALRLGAERIREDQSLSLPIRIEILNTIADVQRTLDQEDDARAFLDEALQLAEASAEPPRLQYAETLFQHGLLESAQTNFETSTAFYDRALGAITDEQSPPADRLRARVLIQRAGMKARFGQAPAAETDLDQAEAIISRMNPPDLELAMLVANTRGVAAYHTARYEEAYEYLQETAALHRKMGNENEAGMVQTLSSLAGIATMLGRLDEALEHDRQSVAIARQTYPAGHRQIGSALYALGDTLRQLGRFEEAEQNLVEARAIQEASANEAEIQMIDRTLLRILVARGDYQQAAALATRLRPAIEERWGSASRHNLLILEAEITAAWHADDRAMLQSALATAAERLASLDDTDGWVPLAQMLRWRLGHVAWLQRDFEQTRHWLDTSALAPDDSAHHPTPEQLLAGLALRLPVGQGHPVPGAIIEQALERLKAPEAGRATASATAYAWCSLLMAYRHNGDSEGAERALKQLRALYDNDRRLSAEAREEIETLL